MHTNSQLELAYRYVTETDCHLFLTGKAGTGKTTFLHRVRKEVSKRMVIVAPTGVAAINARGVTIHSQFQLPFGVLTPDRIQRELSGRRLSRKKADVLRNLDLLIIDEISMVRVDVLEAIGAVLSRYRRDDRPFGGVQLLLIGDLHQLPPVVRDEDVGTLQRHYTTPYFFGSPLLQRAGLRTIQLTHIYRQADDEFIRLLNRVRTDALDKKDLAALNSRYRDTDFIAAHARHHITLTSHNQQARRLNERRLAELRTPLHTYSAVVEGKFPESMYPNDPKLSFRVGARVMFNKNDTSEHRYYNGKIGRIVAIVDEEITVSCPGGERLTVVPVVWENRSYEVHSSTRGVAERIIGTYTQHPLRLAWAITIHKSQGLTFERAIVDAAHAFAHGQVYVALSRCKTFDGIILKSRIGVGSVRTDREVSDYSERAEAEAPTEADLREDRRRYHLNCLREIFSFQSITGLLARLVGIAEEREASIVGSFGDECRALRQEIERFIALTSHRFRACLDRYGTTATSPTDNPDLRVRIAGAVTYFLPLLRNAAERAAGLHFHSDNERVKDQLSTLVDGLRYELRAKILAFGVLKTGFTPASYLRSKALALAPSEDETAPKPVVRDTVGDELLFDRLVKWRKDIAEEKGIPAYCVLHNSVLMAIATDFPECKRDLMDVRGFGAKSWERYGEEILTFVANHTRSPKSEVPPPRDRRPSRDITYELFRRGHPVSAIAAQRSLTEGTIYRHLAEFVRSGSLSVEKILSEEARAAILPTLAADGGLTDRAVYDLLQGTFAYHEIQLARASLPVLDPAGTSTAGENSGECAA
jgi:hypothetical protein